MPEHVQSLERGIAVIRSFSADTPRQTLADVSRATGLTRATSRRLLLTLVDLGYARTDGKTFELTPSILDLGYSFLASLGIDQIAQPFIEQLSEDVHESSSISVLDDTDIVYVARVPTKRIMNVSIGLGSRFPAYQTSMGRVLLAELDNDAIISIFERSDRDRRTPRTVTDGASLLEHIERVRADGWALLDQELELGVRSVAAPVRDAHGCAVAAINVSTLAARTDMRELRRTIVPRLLAAANDVTDALSRR
ncbi:MAG: IclR family transcriptional regulator C-terminal domain-containing protein [Actinomycetota bacterium]